MPDQTIAAFIEARYHSLTQLANVISAGGDQPQRWILREDVYGQWPPEIIALDLPIGAPDDEEPGESRVAIAYNGRNEAEHMITWDPASVLADIASKRALLAALEDNVRHWGHDDHTRAAAMTALEAAQRHLAAPFAAHPDYDPDWSVER